MPPFTAGSNSSGVRSKYLTAMTCSVPVSGGTTEAMHDARDLLARDPVVVAEVGHQDAQLVGRPLANRRQPPAVDQLGSLEHADDDVGVADVDC